MKIILLIGIIIITVSTMGFGATLGSSPSIHKIGGNDNMSVSTAADITNIVANVQGNNVDYADITVKNIDSVSHIYKICMILKTESILSSTTGASPNCTNTTSISAGNTGTVRVNFSNQLPAADIIRHGISVQAIN